jgi:hypothetical protein
MENKWKAYRKEITSESISGRNSFGLSSRRMRNFLVDIRKNEK